MKRFEIKNNSNLIRQPNFIGSWNIDNNNLCTEIISYFEENKNLQRQGITAGGKNTLIKKRTDITIAPQSLDDLKFRCFKDYMNELHKCFQDYNVQWPFLKTMLKNVDIGIFNIGKYLPLPQTN